MTEIDPSTPTSYSSTIACTDLFPAVWPQTNHFRFLLPVFKTGSRISEAKLTSKLLRNGSTERTKHVWPPVEQMTPRIGARAQTGSRNMAVMAEIESSTHTSYLSPFCMYGYSSSRLAANKLLFPVSTSGFQNRKSYFGGKTDVQIA